MFFLRTFIVCLFFVGFSSCEHYIYVQKHTTSAKNLASTFSQSRDSLQKIDYTGENLFVGWALPSSIRIKNHELVVDVLYKDLSTEKFVYPIPFRIGRVAVSLVDEDFQKKEGFLAYNIKLVNKDTQKIIDQRVHKLWVDVK